jgi:hypothetical protein
MNYIWNKAVLTFYRQKIPHESEPFAVVKSKKLTIQKSSEKKIVGEIENFFPLMGNLANLTSMDGIAEKYVICWFDDSIEDITLSFRRIAGVSFIAPLSFVIDKNGKKSFSVKFEAISGKLE